jgi:Protein of unknown function (DUF3168)
VAETGAVDAALLDLLRGDAALLALCPDGIQYAVADPTSKRFVLVDRIAADVDRRLFGGAAWEAFVYLVKAVLPEPTSRNAREAARLIRARLDGAVMTPDGYALLAPIEEIEPIRLVEVDSANPDRRVQHWGGQYAVIVQRTN